MYNQIEDLQLSDLKCFSLASCVFFEAVKDISETFRSIVDFWLFLGDFIGDFAKLFQKVIISNQGLDSADDIVNSFEPLAVILLVSCFLNSDPEEHDMSGKKFFDSTNRKN